MSAGAFRPRAGMLGALAAVGLLAGASPVASDPAPVLRPIRGRHPRGRSRMFGGCGKSKAYRERKRAFEQARRHRGLIDAYLEVCGRDASDLERLSPGEIRARIRYGYPAWRAKRGAR